MKKNIIIELIFISIIFLGLNCKENTKEKTLRIMDFREFVEVFTKAVKERDINTIEKLAHKDFHYSTYDFRNKWNTRELALKNFDFELADKIISLGYTWEGGKSAFSHPKGQMDKTNGYAIRFFNEGKGWQILMIDQGPLGEKAVPAKP